MLILALWIRAVKMPSVGLSVNPCTFATHLNQDVSKWLLGGAWACYPTTVTANASVSIRVHL